MKNIHKDLRKVALFAKLFASFKSEKQFVKTQKMTSKIFNGKKSKDLSYEKLFITTKDNEKLRICIYKSIEPKDNAVGLLWIHGGGYAIGAPEQDIDFIRSFIKNTNCVVIAPDYTLSPIKPFPAALNDCYNTLLWIKDNANYLGINDSQIFVGGDSAGGCLTAAVSLLSRDKKEVNIAF